MKELMDALHSAVEAAKVGDFETTLERFVWMHDHPVREMLSSEMTRRVYGFFTWAQIGVIYPPALAKLRELLEAKKAHLALHPDDSYTAADAGAMQQALLSILEHQQPENQNDR